MPKLKIVERLVSTRDVRAVATNQDGTWMATTGGLLHLKGGKLTAYSNADGLPPGRLHALLMEDDGSFWVAGDKGAVRARLETDRLRIEHRVKVRGVRALTEFQGRLYWATWGTGLQQSAKGDSSTRPVRRANRDRWQTLSALVVADGSLYVASVGAGVLHFDGKRITPIRRGMPSYLVWSLAFDGERVWAATSSGLVHIKGKKAERTPFLKNRINNGTSNGIRLGDVRAISIRGDRIFVGRFGGGVWRIRPDGRPLTVVGVPRNAYVWAIHDSGSKLRVGARNGLWVQRMNTFSHWALEGPLSNDISSIAQSRSGLWVGTFDSGLSRFHKGHWKHFGLNDGLVDDRINHVAIQDDGGKEIVWIATPRGASRYVDGAWKSYAAGAPNGLARGHVNAIQAVGSTVYFASSAGVSVFDGIRWQRFGKPQGFPLRQATTISLDDYGGLWVGGLAGAARLIRATGRWTRRQTTTNGDLPDDWVTALVTDGRKVWSGTYDGGLATLKENGRPDVFTEKGSSLPCGWVNPQAMTKVGPYLWVGTMEGGLLAHRDGEWRSYTTKSGLPSNDITAIAAGANGDIWVASRAGIVRARLKQGDVR